MKEIAYFLHRKTAATDLRVLLSLTCALSTWTPYQGSAKGCATTGCSRRKSQRGGVGSCGIGGSVDKLIVEPCDMLMIDVLVSHMNMACCQPVSCRFNI